MHNSREFIILISDQFIDLYTYRYVGSEHSSNILHGCVHVSNEFILEIL